VNPRFPVALRREAGVLSGYYIYAAASNQRLATPFSNVFAKPVRENGSG
jgi:hypothetical protein